MRIYVCIFFKAPSVSYIYIPNTHTNTPPKHTNKQQGPLFPTKAERARLASGLIRGGVELLSEAVTAAGRALEAGDEAGVNFYGKEAVALCQLAQVCGGWEGLGWMERGNRGRTKTHTHINTRTHT